MSDVETLTDRKKDRPTLDELTTLIWTLEMGQRLALVRMKLLWDQKQLGKELGVTQSTISRIELGQLDSCTKITVAALKLRFLSSFSFIVFGTNPERYNEASIKKSFWDRKLRIRRDRKPAYSKA